MLTSDWSDQDIQSYLSFCDEVQIVDASVPLQVWAHESDNRTTAHNPGGASGIFQLTQKTAAGLGYPTDKDPDLTAFRQLHPSEQLHWAAKYYGSHRGNIGTVARFYTCTFLPTLTHCADDPEFVLTGREGPLAWAYEPNRRAFDRTNKGFINVQDLVDAAKRATGPRTLELIGRVQAFKEPNMVAENQETD